MEIVGNVYPTGHTNYLMGVMKCHNQLVVLRTFKLSSIQLLEFSEYLQLKRPLFRSSLNCKSICKPHKLVKIVTTSKSSRTTHLYFKILSPQISVCHLLLLHLIGHTLCQKRQIQKATLLQQLLISTPNSQVTLQTRTLRLLLKQHHLLNQCLQLSL